MSIQQYLNSKAHGYLMESEACELLGKELECISAKLEKRAAKEDEKRRADLDAAMLYHSVEEIHDAYGWDLISEKTYRWYLELFQNGQKVLEEHAPTVTEIELNILKRILRDIDRDRQNYAFEALTPKEKQAEIERAQQAQKQWRIRLKELRTSFESFPEDTGPNSSNPQNAQEECVN